MCVLFLNIFSYFMETYANVSTSKYVYINVTALSLTPCVLDKPEVLAGVTEQPRFPPWEFDTICKNSFL